MRSSTPRFGRARPMTPWSPRTRPRQLSRSGPARRHPHPYAKPCVSRRLRRLARTLTTRPIATTRSSRLRRSTPRCCSAASWGRKSLTSPARTEPSRVRLAIDLEPLDVLRHFRGRDRLVALFGAWHHGEALIAFDPVDVLEGDPFDGIDLTPTPD